MWLHGVTVSFPNNSTLFTLSEKLWSRSCKVVVIRWIYLLRLLVFEVDWVIQVLPWPCVTLTAPWLNLAFNVDFDLLCLLKWCKSHILPWELARHFHRRYIRLIVLLNFWWNPAVSSACTLTRTHWCIMIVPLEVLAKVSLLGCHTVAYMPVSTDGDVLVLR